MALELPLMEDNIAREDLKSVVAFLNQDPAPILTNNKKCREFEEAWSDWLGVKYSVFVNSGSAANTIIMQVVKEIYGDGEVIVPPLTWVSDILAVTRAGLTPRFVDINKNNLCMNEDLIIKALNKKTRAIFLTHILGFNGLSDNLLSILKDKNIPLIEDVCESHGATYNNKKLGSYGLASNFSFYFAHHLSTIEGGMVCTNDENVYEMSRMIRSHGMTREIDNKIMRDQVNGKYPDLRPEFIFAHAGYNFRSTEINAVIGLSQLPRLDQNNKIRTENFKFFLKNLNSDKYFTDFDIEGCSNYALVLLLKEENKEFCEKVIATMQEEQIEFRRGTAGGGNHLRQPYLKKILGDFNLDNFPIVDFIHFNGFYIGNYPSLKKDKILKLCDILNSV